MYPIVLLVGQAGSGKDTVADLLVKNHNGVKISLAAPIKTFAQIVFGFSDHQLYGPSSARAETVRVLGGFDSMVYDNYNAARWLMDIFGTTHHAEDWYNKYILPHKEVSARHVLQTFGTECGRAVNPDVWVDVAIESAKAQLATKDLVVIPDGRFRNEVLAVKAVGGTVIQIRNPDGVSPESHASEREQNSIPTWWYNKVFVNYKDGLDKLESRVLFWELQ
jgi:hypothetical protein